MNAIAKRENWKIVGWIVGGIAVIALVWFLIGRLFPDNKPGPTKNEKTADSLLATKPAEQALLDSLDARIRSRALVSERAASTARMAQDQSGRSRRVADSLAVARAWQGAYNERSKEASLLRIAVAQKDTIIASLKADTTDLRTQLGIVNRRLATTEAVVVGLRWDLDKARKCKIIGLINCPNRIQTVALTAIAFYAVDRYQRR